MYITVEGTNSLVQFCNVNCINAHSIHSANAVCIRFENGSNVKRPSVELFLLPATDGNNNAGPSTAHSCSSMST